MQNQHSVSEKPEFSKEYKKQKKSITCGSFMKNSSLLKIIHPPPQYRVDQKFDIMIEGTNLAIQFVPLSYHLKFPRATELKLQDLKQVKDEYHRYILLMIDAQDKTGQVTEVQKLAIRFNYRLIIAWGLKDAKDLIDDFTASY